MDGYQSSGISSVKRIFSFFSGSSARNRGSRWFLRCETRLIFIESISLLTIVENEHNSTFELWVTRIKEIGPSAPIIRSFNHSSRNWIRSLIFTKRLEKKREKKEEEEFSFLYIYIFVLIDTSKHRLLMLWAKIIATFSSSTRSFRVTFYINNRVIRETWFFFSSCSVFAL